MCFSLALGEEGGGEGRMGRGRSEWSWRLAYVPARSLLGNTRPLSVIPTSGTPHGLLSLSFLAWLCALLNQTGSPVTGWRLIGLSAVLTAWSRPGLPSRSYIIYRSMSNLGSTATSTSPLIPSFTTAGREGGMSRFDTLMRTLRS